MTSLRAVSSGSGAPVTSQLLVAIGQSIGMQRDHNEDTVFVHSSVLGGETKDLIFGLYILADGMGGYQHGEVASNVAANAMAHYILKKIYLPLMSLKGDQPSDPLQEIMQTGSQRSSTSCGKVCTRRRYNLDSRVHSW